MFTSRAEHRLLLRIDNADLRLTPRGRDIGLVDDERWERFRARKSRFETNVATVRRTSVPGVSGVRVPASRALQQAGVTLSELYGSGQVALALAGPDPSLDLASLETEFKYEGYLRRQAAAVERQRRLEDRAIPMTFAYRGVPGLSREVVERLSHLRPVTLGQALRIPGVTPAAAAIIASHLTRRGD
jgi:tRNA uridine 5-carboxymethylaminomethyl modification enzyme